MEKVLLEKKLIDHRILYRNFCVKNVEINLYSLNIAQKSDLRTMLMFNKIQCFLKGSEKSKIKIDASFFDEIPKLLIQFNLHLKDIEEGSKNEIKDVEFIKALQKITKNSFEKVFLRRYIPKGKLKTDDIFRKRFEKTNFNYIDIVFSEEKLAQYQLRIRTILRHLQKITEKQINLIFCFQEIKPISVFFKELKELKEWSVVDPVSFSIKQESKSNNVLIRKNFPYKIERLHTIKHDTILQIFSKEIFENGSYVSQRNINQNVKYFIPELKLYLYNIHSFLQTDPSVLNIFQKKIVPYMETKKDPVVIIGDFNMKMEMSTLKKLSSFLSEKKIDYIFTPSFTNRKVKTYDACILRLP